MSAIRWQNGLDNADNFSPRIGYIWLPEKSGKFIVRGGAGVFYDWLDTGKLAAILSNDERQGQKIIVRNPGFPNPFNCNVISQIPSNCISRLADDLIAPYIFVKQNGFNYKLDKSEGIYTFKKGLHHYRSRNINAPINGVRPNPNFGIIQQLESSGNTQENSFELKVNCYYRGINMFANYELSKKNSDFAGAFYVGIQTSPFFRKLTSARSPRSLEFGLSFNF